MPRNGMIVDCRGFGRGICVVSASMCERPCRAHAHTPGHTTLIWLFTCLDIKYYSTHTRAVKSCLIRHTGISLSVCTSTQTHESRVTPAFLVSNGFRGRQISIKSWGYRFCTALYLLTYTKLHLHYRNGIDNFEHKSRLFFLIWVVLLK